MVGFLDIPWFYALKFLAFSKYASSQSQDQKYVRLARKLPAVMSLQELKKISPCQTKTSKLLITTLFFKGGGTMSK